MSRNAVMGLRAGGIHGDLFKNFVLGVEVSNAVMQKWIPPTLFDTRCSTDHDDGRFLRVSPAMELHKLSLTQ